MKKDCIENQNFSDKNPVLDIFSFGEHLN